MNGIKGNRIVRMIILFIFFASCLTFFGIFLKYHLFFVEQLQVFLLTFDHFAGYLSKPAFISSYIGDFLTQFFWLRWGGAVVITSVLFILFVSLRQLFKKFLQKEVPFFLPFIPVILSWITLCEIDYPISVSVGMIVSVLISLMYLSIKQQMLRFSTGIILLPLLYLATGSSFYILSVVMIIRELREEITGRITRTLLTLFITCTLPFMLKGIFLLTSLQAYTWLSVMDKIPEAIDLLPLGSVLVIILSLYFPFGLIQARTNSVISSALQIVVAVALLVTGIKRTADFQFEKILHLDYEALHNCWENVYNLSARYDMHNSIAAYYSNMALSKLGVMPEELMEHYQPAATGLFIPVNANENYITITFSNEVYWHLGDVNASQHSALLGTIFSPRAQNSRLMKRIAEINIVNGEYAVAEKYLNILGKTMFHRRWASERIRFLYNENECNRSEWITQKRAIIPERDMLTDRNEYVKTLRMLADNHPDNCMAIDYLLCYHLLCKDLASFTRDFESYYKQGMNSVLPKVYQEGLLIKIVAGEKTPEDFKNFRFNPSIIKRMAEYTDLYDKNKGNGKMLYSDYGKTYWYYYHFARMKTE